MANNSDAPVDDRYLCFSIANEKFAIPLLQVREVIGNVPTTPIPNTPSHFKGIMNLRGLVISIIDLRSKLKMPAGKTSSETSIIILAFSHLMLGVVVDSVDFVSKFDAKDISQTPEIESSANAQYISGVARTEKALTLILNLKALLNIADVKVIENQQAQSAVA